MNALTVLVEDWHGMTRAEYRVANAVANGASNEEAAADLGWSAETVRTYLSGRIFPRLGVKSRYELMRWWIDHVEQRGNCKTCILALAHREGEGAKGEHSGTN